MPRVKLALPSIFPFRTELEIRIADINYGGHLGNDSVLSLAHEARIRFLSSFGYTEKDIEGSGIIMTDAVIVYRGEGFHGDRLLIEIAVDDIQSHRCDLLYRFSRVADQKEIARLKTGISFYDYGKRTIAPVPAEFKARISRSQQPAATEQ